MSDDRDGRLRGTSAATLAVAALLGGAVGGLVRPLAERSGGIAPPVGWAAPLTLAFFAVVLLLFAWSTHKTLHERRERIDSQRAVNLLVLGKASALVGSLMAGGYLAYAASFVRSMQASLPRERVLHSAVACAFAVLVMVGGLALERACRVPGDDSDDEGAPRSGRSGGGVAPGGRRD
ncbi:MAG: DUF3180 domain-containing protein [Nocardioidaceae bacterium]